MLIFCIFVWLLDAQRRRDPVRRGLNTGGGRAPRALSTEGTRPRALSTGGRRGGW